jgi:predicted transcriptional regulator
MKPRYPTSIRISDEVKHLLDRLTNKLELSQADVIAMAIRELAKKEGIE